MPANSKIGVWLRARELDVLPLGDLWLYHKKDILPAEGWKIHISATPSTLIETLELIAHLLHGVSFKVVACEQTLARLNSAIFGRRGVGKALTFYPQTTSAFVRLAASLDKALAGTWGPSVPTDRRLSHGSRVHYRYGSFGGHQALDRWGRLGSVMIGPNGTTIFDRPETDFALPAWIKDPFWKTSKRSSEFDDALLSTFNLTPRELVRQGRRTIIRCHTHDRIPCVIKLVHSRDHEALLALENERRMAERLVRHCLSPRVLMFGQVGEHQAVVYEDVGVDLATQGCSSSDIEETFSQILSGLARLHAEGLVVGDFSLGNLVLTSYGICFIDLEQMNPMGISPKKCSVTPGFDSLHPPGHWRRDISAAGRGAIQLWCGLRSALLMDELNEAQVEQLLWGAPSSFVLRVCAALRYDAPAATSLLHLTEGMESNQVNPDCGLPLLAVVDEIARGLLDEARACGGGWRSAKRGPQWVVPSFLSGDLGPAWFLLSHCGQHEEAIDIATQAIDLALLQQWDCLDGLYAGPWGLYLAELKCGVIRDEEWRVERALEWMRCSVANPASHLDIFTGLAGRLAVLCHACSEVTTSRLYDECLACSCRLVDAWLSVRTSIYVNGIHDSATGWLGVAEVLRTTARLLADHELLGYADEITDRATLYIATSPFNARYTSWCNGIVGCGISLARSLEDTQNSDRQALLENYISILSDNRPSGVGICHGLGGTLRLASIARAHRIPGASVLEHRCLRILLGARVAHGGGTSWISSAVCRNSSYMDGASGIGDVIGHLVSGSSPLMPHEM